MTRIAITSSSPMPVSEDWNAAAVPWKMVRTVAGSDSLRGLLDAVDGIAQRNARGRC